MPAGLRTRRPVEDDANDWLITFADVISILLAMFVLILKVSSFDVGKHEALIEAWSPLSSGKERPTPFTDIKNGVTEIVNDAQMQQSIQVEMQPDGVMIEFSDLSLFKQGKADLNPRSLSVLNDMTDVIIENMRDHHHIEIEGHTDDVPIHNSEFASNWELSSARATGVVRFLQAKGVDPYKLNGSAFADTRPKVGVDNQDLSLSDIRAANRRVVILVKR